MSCTTCTSLYLVPLIQKRGEMFCRSQSLWWSLGMVWLVRLRLALMLLVLYFSALEIENIDAGTDNLEDNDLTISVTVSETSTDGFEGLSKKTKKRKYHWLYSNSVMLEWRKGCWRVKASGGLSDRRYLAVLVAWVGKHRALPSTAQHCPAHHLLLCQVPHH